MLALCIRLWGELVLGRYALPIPSAKEFLLAKHAHGLLEEVRQTIRRLPGGHRSEAAEYELLPEAERAIVAQGHAARGCRRCYLTCTSARRSAVTRLGSPRTPAIRARTSARGRAPRSAPDIERYLDVGYAMRASIVSDAAWPGQVERMPKYKGNAQSGIPGVMPGNDGARL